MLRRSILPVLIILWVFFLTVCSENTQKPVFPGAEWTEVSPENQGVDPEKLAAAVAYLQDELNSTGGDGRQLYPVAPGNLFLASGFNDNKYFVIPDWKMVILRMGVNGTSDIQDAIWNGFLRQVGASPKGGF